MHLAGFVIFLLDEEHCSRVLTIVYELGYFTRTGKAEPRGTLGIDDDRLGVFDSHQVRAIPLLSVIRFVKGGV